jgi:hypothetical protein
MIRTGPFECHYKKQTYLTWLNEIKHFVTHMNSYENNKIPFFSFNFLTQYNHDYFVIPKDLDTQLRDMLANFQIKGYLNNTMLILWSDHGNRLASYSVYNDQGRLEKNNPFLSVRLPEKLKNTRYFLNAFNNQNKLVSGLDLFQTLKQFLYINKFGLKIEPICEEKFKRNDKNDRNTRGISLFEPINMNRSCADALIPYMLCNCITKTNLNEKQMLKETNFRIDDVSSLIVTKLNQITSKQRNKCSEFRFDRLVSFKRVNAADSLTYELIVVVQPGDAWFESSIKLKLEKKDNQTVFNYLPKRISAYGNQSYCVMGNLVDYCFCR